MNRLEECFRKLRGERRKALMPYLTAGDPDLDVSFDLALACEQGGADLLELGIPFSGSLSGRPDRPGGRTKILRLGNDLCRHPGADPPDSTGE